MPKWLLTPLQTFVSLFLFVEVSAVVGLSLFPLVTLWLWVPLEAQHPRLVVHAVAALCGPILNPTIG